MHVSNRDWARLNQTGPEPYFVEGAHSASHLLDRAPFPHDGFVFVAACNVGFESIFSPDRYSGADRDWLGRRDELVYVLQAGSALLLVRDWFDDSVAADLLTLLDDGSLVETRFAITPQAKWPYSFGTSRLFHNPPVEHSPPEGFYTTWVRNPLNLHRVHQEAIEQLGTPVSSSHDDLLALLRSRQAHRIRTHRSGEVGGLHMFETVQGPPRLLDRFLVVVFIVFVGLPLVAWYLFLHLIGSRPLGQDEGHDLSSVTARS